MFNDPILADFKRIDIILVIYKALYFTYPPPKHDFSHIFRLVCFFYRRVPDASYNSCTFPYSQMTKQQLSPFFTCTETVPSTLSSILYSRQNCRHYEFLPLLCPINATSSSCVFILYNPTILYAIKFLKVILY